MSCLLTFKGPGQPPASTGSGGGFTSSRLRFCAQVHYLLGRGGVDKNRRLARSLTSLTEGRQRKVKERPQEPYSWPQSDPPPGPYCHRPAGRSESRAPIGQECSRPGQSQRRFPGAQQARCSGRTRAGPYARPRPRRSGARCSEFLSSGGVLAPRASQFSLPALVRGSTSRGSCRCAVPPQSCRVLCSDRWSVLARPFRAPATHASRSPFN